MGKIEKIVRGGGVALALALCAFVSAGVVTAFPQAVYAETVGAFEVTAEPGSAENSYSYAAGILTVNDGANITISMADGAVTPTTDRIVVSQNALATVTLDGVSINAPASAIDVSGSARLTLLLGSNESVLVGASGAYAGHPGIHVSASATLIIDGAGSLSVSGGGGAYSGGVGIGGSNGFGPLQSGETCGTVVVQGGSLTVTGGSASSYAGGVGIGGGTGGVTTNGGGGTVIVVSDGSISIAGGGGAQPGGAFGSNGHPSYPGSPGVGIRPAGDGTYSVFGDLTLPCDITIPEGVTVIVSEGTSLTVPQGVTLTNNGTILMQGGTLIGEVTGNQPIYQAELGNLTVTGGTGADGVFRYGDTVTVTFMLQRKGAAGENAAAEGTASLAYAPNEGEAVTLATATAEADGSFTLAYDTKDRKLPVGDDLPLTVSYSGSSTLTPTEGAVGVTLEKAPLRNVPTVTGSFVFGETLTASYTKQDDEEVSYQWFRGDEAISGATGVSYALTGEDVGESVYVIVSPEDAWHIGELQSAQQVVAKAVQSAPTPSEGYVIDYKREAMAASDGFELATSVEAEIAADELAVEPGAVVYVRRSETASHLASVWIAVTVPERPEPPVEGDFTVIAPGRIGGMGYVVPTDGVALEYRMVDGSWRELGNEAVELSAGASVELRFSADDEDFASEAVTVTMPGHVHIASSEWISDKNGHWHVCASDECDVLLDADGHEYGGWVVTEPPTQSDAGEEVHTCVVCGRVETRGIPATGHPAAEAPADESDEGAAIPATSDAAMLGVPALALLGSISVVGVVLVRRRGL